MRRTLTLLVVGVLGMVAGLVGANALGATGDAASRQQARLLQRAVLPAASFRAGSPPSGAFISSVDRASARNNGVPGPDSGPYFTSQPVQGISALIPAGGGTWWGLPDNGYGGRDNSADWQLAIYRLDLRFGKTTGPRLLSTVVLSDPGRHVKWKTVCDPTRGSDLPPFSFNVLPESPPPACGSDPAARILTGFDFDPESIQIAHDGTFWIGEEFGPFLLHVDRAGRLLGPPVSIPKVKSPQNPTLDLARGEEPTVAQSRGVESLAISPDRTKLYPLLEGAVGADHAQDLRVYTYDIERRRFIHGVNKIRLEMPGAKVDLSALRLVNGERAYPDATRPTGTGGESAAELTAVNDHQFLLVERDGAGDGTAAPRFKKVLLVEAGKPAARARYLAKQLLIDLMAIPDPGRIGEDGDFFRFPFNTIEAVHVVDDTSVVVANDNNYPFSTGRSRSRTNERTGPLSPDDNEFILVRLGRPLQVDRRLLSAPALR
jgi:hypothetical protein